MWMAAPGGQTTQLNTARLRERAAAPHVNFCGYRAVSREFGVARRVAERMEKLRGYDRRPTEEEALAPPDQRPWTEYDGRGDKQSLPPFKALGVGPCLCFGPTCCVFELQWPEWLCN